MSQVSQSDDEIDDNRQTEDAVFMDPRTASFYLRGTINNCVGFSCEAEAVDTANNCDRFVRAFEHATCDGALLVHDRDLHGLPADATDRFYTLVRELGTSQRQTVIPVDIKAFVWSVVGHGESRRNQKHAQAHITLSNNQVEVCQAIILVNIADPEWVAFVPRSYFRRLDERQGQSYQYMKYGTVARSMVTLNPFPPVLAHLVMRKSDLPQILSDFAECAINPNKLLINPYTGNSLRRQEQPLVKRFSSMLPENTGEFRLRKQLWKVLNTTNNSGLSLKNPSHAPLTSDIRLEHTSGVKVFVEIKCSLARTSRLPGGGQRLSHMQTMPMSSIGIFTFKAPWDWLLTMVNDAEGYLILKDDIPAGFWHQVPDQQGWIHHEFPDNKFLNERRIIFNQPSAQISSHICRIMKGVGAPQDHPPRISTLSYRDILLLAGPCPPGMLRQSVRGEEPGADIDDDIAAPPAADGDEGNGSDDDDIEGDEDGEADDAGEAVNNWTGTGFSTRSVLNRLKITGHREIRRTAQFIQVLMKQCRVKGQGCVLDLGLNHPKGCVGFIQYYWSDTDKDVFDRCGQPPCWAGKVANCIPVLTMQLMNTRWRQGYAPNEGTLGETNAYLQSAQCLVICTSYPREIGHLLNRRWVVPSEFMPQIQIGQFKGSHIKLPLIMQNKLDIERLIVEDMDLLTTMLQFFSGQAQIRVGIGSVAVDPNRYLTTMNTIKLISDVEFESCVRAYLA